MSNCNFADNKATGYYGRGGAVYFYGEGGVSNCNFTNNQATGTKSWGGAIMFGGTGTVTNCNFTGNTASINGGAVYFDETGTVSNCNFADNSANSGGAILSWNWYTAADTCIFKRNSGDNVNVVIYPPTLNVDNFTTVYGSGEKLTFNLTTDSGMPVNNGNISISVYFKDNSSWVGNYSCLSGEGWTVDLPVGSYYANFTTEYAGFQAINRTINVIPNIPYYVNVTPVTTNNRTVNITAKSNLPQDILEGKLLFILPNGDVINATYAVDGIWWAVHTFDDYTCYQLNASYIGLDNVTVSNTTINITKANSTVEVGDAVLNYGEIKNVIVTAQGATGITATIDNNPVKVINNYTIVISGLDVGTHTLTATTIADEDHNPVTRNATITVNKAKTELTAKAVKTTYNVNKNLVITLKDSTGKALSGVKVSVNLKGTKTYTTDKNGQIKINVAKLVPKTYTAKVTFEGNANYLKSTADVKVTVKKAKPKITAKKKTYKLKSKNKKFTITLKDNKGKAIKKAKVTIKVIKIKKASKKKSKKSGMKNILKAKTNKKGKATFKINRNSKGKYQVIIKYKGNKYYKSATKKVKITIK